MHSLHTTASLDGKSSTVQQNAENEFKKVTKSHRNLRKNWSDMKEFQNVKKMVINLNLKQFQTQIQMPSKMSQKSPKIQYLCKTFNLNLLLKKFHLFI